MAAAIPPRRRFCCASRLASSCWAAAERRPRTASATWPPSPTAWRRERTFCSVCRKRPWKPSLRNFSAGGRGAMKAAADRRRLAAAASAAWRRVTAFSPAEQGPHGEKAHTLCLRASLLTALQSVPRLSSRLADNRTRARGCFAPGPCPILPALRSYSISISRSRKSTPLGRTIWSSKSKTGAWSSAVSPVPSQQNSPGKRF